MKRARSKKREHFEFAIRLGDSFMRLRVQKPNKQTSARLVKWVLTLLLALLILLAPELWQAIQRALSVMHR
jgi:hypothetical protein